MADDMEGQKDMPATTEGTTLTVPMVHMNGTSRTALFDGYYRALQAVQDAMIVVRECAPNGRDYYPLGGDAILRAMDEHKARVQKLYDISKELQVLAEAVVES